MKLSDFVSSYIVKQGIHNVFLLPGGGNMHLVDSFGKEKGISVVPCLHEQAAAIAADGYAQFSGKHGVALVTTGPGGTNAVTGVAGAWVESVPLIVISGQVKTPDIKPAPDMRMLGFQEVDIVSIVKTITKYAVTVKDPKSILFHLEKAFNEAISGRPGPAWIDIPLDVQSAIIDEKELVEYNPVKVIRDHKEITEAVKKTLDLLKNAERPVIMAGNGIRLSGARDKFLELIRKLNVPVLTTWKAMDMLSDDDPLFFGRPGTVANRGANFIQQNSDLILSLGCRLDFGQIGYAQETFAREAKKVIVDIDPNEFTKFKFNIDIKVRADASDFLQEMLSQLKYQEIKTYENWCNRCLPWKNKYPVVLDKHRKTVYGISTYLLVEKLSEFATEDDVIVPCSSGSAADITSQSFKVKEGQRVLNSPGIGSMGFGVPQSMGACLAGNKRRTICINGDGGFQLNIQELETIRRLNLPVKFFYLNNQGYLSIRTTQGNYFNGRMVASGPSSGLSLPDIRKIADAYGIKSNTISRASEINGRVEEALNADGPFICEVLIDPDEQVEPKVKSALNSEGKMVSKPLEDLAPFLDRTEFIQNMIVKPLEE